MPFIIVWVLYMYEYNSVQWKGVHLGNTGYTVHHARGITVYYQTQKHEKEGVLAHIRHVAY